MRCTRRGGRRLGTVGGVALCAGVLALAISTNRASAQVIPRPADERPALEPLDAPDEKPPSAPLTLPPPPAPRSSASPLASGIRIILSDIVVEGSTIFSRDELSRVTRPYRNKSILSSDLVDLTNALTQLYIDQGYKSSGAVIPDQDLDGGVLRIEIVEARIVDVRVEGNRWQRESFLASRLMAEISEPVRVEDVEDQLQLLLQHPDIVRVAGKLVPGAQRGENVLELRIEEELPWGLRGSVANDSPPAIGSVRGIVTAENRSLFGFQDVVRGDFEFAEGLTAQDVRYEFPLGPYGTTLRGRFRRTDSEVIQDPFDKAEIDIETLSARVALRQLVYRKPHAHIAVDAMFERRSSTTRVFGERISLVEGPDDGESEISLVRFSVEGAWRSTNDVIAARSMITKGFHAFGSTNNSGDTPDGKYVAWLGQAQWAHRFPDWLFETQLVVRGDVQLSSDPLLSLERIAIGGVRTVRGYRENVLVRDNAVIASAELRIPLIAGEAGVVELAPFYDWGSGWNEERTPLPKTIRSAGVGLRFHLYDRIHAYAYWAEPLRDVPDTNENIQEEGFHLGVSVTVF